MVVEEMTKGDMYGCFHDGLKGPGKVVGKEGKGEERRGENRTRDI